MRVQLRTSGPLVAALGVVLGVCALLAIIGADSRWLAAVGRVVARQHAIPRGVPFASGATGTWANVPVLAELAFYGLERTLGDRGLMLAELAAVGAALVILARDALAGGATQVGSAWALMLGAIGCLPALAVVRVQLFSLVLFPALVALLRAETRQPSRRIWLAVPLLALWSNLHGAALIGLGLTLVYLSCARLREDPRAAVGVGMAAAVAVCATPAGIRTIAYYHGLLTNQIAARGEGLWAPLSLSAPLDLLLIIAGTGLALQFFRASPSFWERVALAPLAAMTVEASRSGVWLLFFLIPTAARAFRLIVFQLP